MEQKKSKGVPELPEAYTNIRPAYMVQKPNPPSIEAPHFPAPDLIRSHLKEE